MYPSATKERNSNFGCQSRQEPAQRHQGHSSGVEQSEHVIITRLINKNNKVSSNSNHAHPKDNYSIFYYFVMRWLNLDDT
jgi:hypothetical protein